MYLARCVLNPASRNVQRDLANPAELHRTVMRLFRDGAGGTPRSTLGVLYRVDADRRRRELVLLLQSAEAPDFARWTQGYLAQPEDDFDWALAGGANPRVRAVDRERDQIMAGERFAFRLRANTTKKILTKSLPDGTKQNGKRVPVRPEQRLDWLTRRAVRGGFRVEDVRIREIRPLGRRDGAERLSFAGALFEGTLQVADAESFRKALAEGLGPAKAYGFGLLSLAPLPR